MPLRPAARIRHQSDIRPAVSLSSRDHSADGGAWRISVAPERRTARRIVPVHNSVNSKKPDCLGRLRSRSLLGTAEVFFGWMAQTIMPTTYWIILLLVFFSAALF